MYKTWIHSEVNRPSQSYKDGYSLVPPKVKKKKEEKVFEATFSQRVTNMWNKYFCCRG